MDRLLAENAALAERLLMERRLRNAADKWASEKISEVSAREMRFGEGFEAMAQNEGNIEQYRADRITDLFEGLAAAGGPAGLEKALTNAMQGDPILLIRLKMLLIKDPARLAIVEDLLKSTKVRLPEVRQWGASYGSGAT